MKRIPVLLLLLALVCTCLPGCAEGNVLKFDASASLVFEGETLQMILNREGAPAEGELTYTSSNLKAATVDESGVVTGVAKGRTTITATVLSGGKTYRAQQAVTVARKAASVEVKTDKLPVYDPTDEKVASLLTAREDAEENALPVLVLPVKKSYNLQITVLPQDATNRKAVVTSGDENVFTARGASITGKAAGEAILTVANELSPEVSTRFRVLVIQPVTRLSPTEKSWSVAAGDQLALGVDVEPADASMPQVAWSSDNTKIATVDENGVVTGVKRGTVRIVATSVDGGNVRANINVTVTQKATGLTLDKSELTIDTGRSGVLRATVFPNDANDKGVIWSSSDEGVATVNGQGRVTAVALGECEIICRSKSNPEVLSVAAVHVQQPVTKVTLNGPLGVYLGETGQLTWTIEPANASNPALHLTSANTKIFTVTDDGVVTPVKFGKAYVNAVTTDGSNRRARTEVKVLQHVTGVHMLRNTAYIDIGQRSRAGAVLEPKNASNDTMSWESADTSIATVEGNTHQVYITGQSAGETTVTGTTEDGGFQTSLRVKIGDWDHALKLTDAYVNGRGDICLEVRNVSDLNITKVTAEVEAFDSAGNAVVINSKNNTNKINVTYRKTLSPGATSRQDGWVSENYFKPDTGFSKIVVRVVSYQIDNDWIHGILKKNQPKKTYSW